MKFDQFKTSPKPDPPRLASGVDTEAEIELYMLKHGWCPLCSFAVIEDTDRRNIHVSTYTCKMNLLHIFEVDHAAGVVTSLS